MSVWGRGDNCTSRCRLRNSSCSWARLAEGFSEAEAAARAVGAAWQAFAVSYEECTSCLTRAWSGSLFPPPVLPLAIHLPRAPLWRFPHCRPSGSCPARWALPVELCVLLRPGLRRSLALDARMRKARTDWSLGCPAFTRFLFLLTLLRSQPSHLAWMALPRGPVLDPFPG